MEMGIMDGPEISRLGREHSWLAVSEDTVLNVFLISFLWFSREVAEGGG